MPPVKKFPHVNAGRVQTKAMAGIGIEENGPIVELFPEDDMKVGYWPSIIFHVSPSRVSIYAAPLPELQSGT